MKFWAAEHGEFFSRYNLTWGAFMGTWQAQEGNFAHADMELSDPGFLGVADPAEVYGCSQDGTDHAGIASFAATPVGDGGDSGLSMHIGGALSAGHRVVAGYTCAAGTVAGGATSAE